MAPDATNNYIFDEDAKDHPGYFDATDDHAGNNIYDYDEVGNFSTADDLPSNYDTGNFIAGSDISADNHPGDFDDAVDDADDLACNFDGNYDAVAAFDGLNDADINYAGDNKAALYDASLHDTTNYSGVSDNSPVLDAAAFEDHLCNQHFHGEFYNTTIYRAKKYSTPSPSVTLRLFIYDASPIDRCNNQ
jgi:hypothetical protein